MNLTDSSSAGVAPRHHPFGLMLLALLHWAACLLFLPIACGVLVQLLPITDRSIQIGTGMLVLLVLGFSMILNGHLGYGLWTLQPRSYRLALGFYILAFLGQLISIVQHGPLTLMPLVSGVVIVYLRRPCIRAAFSPQ